MNSILLRIVGKIYSALAVLSIFLIFLSPTTTFSAIPQSEIDARNQYRSTLINVYGSVVQLDWNKDISGATVHLQGKTTITDANGHFSFSGLSRTNDWLTISCSGFRQETLPIALRLAPSISEVNLPPVPLITDDENDIRLMFGGDTSFGRRFLDPSEVTPPDQIPEDDPEALILVSDPLPGSKRVLQYIRQYYQNADVGILNFESPVTDNPVTPHPDKDYKYFSLPDSLPALTWLGVDYISLGNNHVYDYLEQGMADTLLHINAAGIPQSGAGMNSPDAFLAHHIDKGDYNYALLSMTSVTGDRYDDSYVAEGDSKGGAADLTQDTEVQAAIQREVNAGYLPIVQLHGGQEYTYFPSTFLQDRFELVAEKKPALIIAHHPHVAQGIGTTDGVLSIHGLGNLAFDQDRLDTMLGLLAQVDLQGREVKQVRLLPVTIKDYRPRPLAGEQAQHFLRRIAEFSTGYGLNVFPYLNQLFVEQSAWKAEVVERRATLPVNIPVSGSVTLDLRQHKTADESLSIIHQNNDELSLKLGRDILIYGDFENHALDDEEFDAPRWSTSETSSYISSFVSVSNAMKGVAGLSSFRSSINTQVSSIRFRNRIRVGGDALNTPLKDLSFFGYLKGNNAGRTELKVEYLASEGENSFGEEYFQLSQGTHNWLPVETVLNMPADSGDPTDRSNNPRALALWLRQYPPETGEATVSFDELAIINWEKTVSPATEIRLDPVNQYDFLKVTGEPGVHNLSLVFRSCTPQKQSLPIDPLLLLLLD